MKKIELQQAVFASADLGRMKGYQLVAKSEGIDRETARELCRWSPSQLPVKGDDVWTLCSAKPDSHRTLISRSLRGGPEYSRRGGNQVVTLLLLIDDDDFGSYEFNAWLLLQTALALGFMRLPTVLPKGQLETVTLPEDPLVRSPDALQMHEDHEQDEEKLHEVMQRLDDGQRLALTGCDQPLQFLKRLIPRMPLETRMRLSFTSGLTPAVRRPFQLHFLPTIDIPLRRTLMSQQIKIIDCEAESLTPAVRN